MVAYHNDEIIEGSMARTVKVEKKSVYMGDGDTNYYAMATIENADGTYSSHYCGKGGGWYNYPDVSNCIVDGDVAKYEAHIAHEREMARIKYANITAYYVEVGKQAIVLAGKRRKKDVGHSGVIIWVGIDRFGNEKCGIKNDNGDVAWTPTQFVQVVPQAEEQILTDCLPPKE